MFGKKSHDRIETTQVTVPTLRGLKQLASPYVSVAASRAQELGEKAQPALQRAAEKARPAVEQAIDQARPKVEHAIEAARPSVEQAASSAKKQAKLGAAALKDHTPDSVTQKVREARTSVKGASPQFNLAVQQVLDQATNPKARKEYQRRAAAAALVLKGEAKAKPRRTCGLAKKVLGVLGIVALVGACTAAARHFLAVDDDPWMRASDEPAEAPATSENGTFGSMYGESTTEDLPLANGSGTDAPEFSSEPKA